MFRPIGKHQVSKYVDKKNLGIVRRVMYQNIPLCWTKLQLFCAGGGGGGWGDTLRSQGLGFSTTDVAANSIRFRLWDCIGGYHAVPF